MFCLFIRWQIITVWKDSYVFYRLRWPKWGILLTISDSWGIINCDITFKSLLASLFLRRKKNVSFSFWGKEGKFPLKSVTNFGFFFEYPTNAHWGHFQPPSFQKEHLTLFQIDRFNCQLSAGKWLDMLCWAPAFTDTNFHLGCSFHRSTQITLK